MYIKPVIAPIAFAKISNQSKVRLRVIFSCKNSIKTPNNIAKNSTIKTDLRDLFFKLFVQTKTKIK